VDIPAYKDNQSLNVLIIDGQVLVHEIIKRALDEHAITKVKSAENAFFALRLCEKTTFDIIIISFDVKSDKDGFNLLEEMKFKGHITKSTSVIFLSAETDPALVNCVVELQPDDFWVKPLDTRKVEQRLKHVLQINRRLHKLQYCIDQEEYAKAIYYAERQLKDESLHQYHPYANRLIGECLCHLFAFEDAEQFYRKLALRYKYAWVSVGIARTLLKQNKIEEGLELTEKLLERDDTRFLTYDLLAQYYIENEEYELGYEIIQKATALAPRNIERNKKSWALARLNHDRKGQYLATLNMAKYAKNSIHDSPELSLNVIRAGIDLASTQSKTEANTTLKRVERRISEIESDYGITDELKEQLDIIDVRMLTVRQDKKQAEKKLKDHLCKPPEGALEDNLDKIKAFHDLGFWEESLALLSKVKNQISDDSFTGRVVSEYLNQEEDERTSIHYTSSELSEMAAVHYKNRRFKPAFNSLEQALQLSPKDAKVCMSILKVVVKLIEKEVLNSPQKDVVQQCVDLLNNNSLSSVQRERFIQHVDELNSSDNVDSNYQVKSVT
jgi:DNA-binding NarL/FixJ family response regulator